jgi:hypothetical protein
MGSSHDLGRARFDSWRVRQCPSWRLRPQLLGQSCTVRLPGLQYLDLDQDSS